MLISKYLTVRIVNIKEQESVKNDIRAGRENERLREEERGRERQTRVG